MDYFLISPTLHLVEKVALSTLATLLSILPSLSFPSFLFLPVKFYLLTKGVPERVLYIVRRVLRCTFQRHLKRLI